MRHVQRSSRPVRAPRIGFAGAPRALESAWIPAFARTRAVLRYVVAGDARTAIRIGRRFCFPEATTQFDRVLDDPEIDALVIVGDHVGGNPLDRERWIQRIDAAHRAGKCVLTDLWPFFAKSERTRRIDFESQAIVGGGIVPAFHRRFAPLIALAAQARAGRGEPGQMELAVRELEPVTATHALDLFAHLSAAPILNVDYPHGGATGELIVRFDDGSRGTLLAVADSRDFRRERLTITCGGGRLDVVDFRCLRGHGPGFSHVRDRSLWRGDDGCAALAAWFVDSLPGGMRSAPRYERAPAPVFVQSLSPAAADSP